MQLEKDSLKILGRALAKLENGFPELAEFDHGYDTERLEAVIMEVAEMMKDKWPDVNFDREYVTCLRSCLMKPKHYDWIECIWEKLERLGA